MISTSSPLDWIEKPIYSPMAWAVFILMTHSWALRALENSSNRAATRVEIFFILFVYKRHTFVSLYTAILLFGCKFILFYRYNQTFVSRKGCFYRRNRMRVAIRQEVLGMATLSSVLVNHIKQGQRQERNYSVLRTLSSPHTPTCRAHSPWHRHEGTSISHS